MTRNTPGQEPQLRREGAQGSLVWKAGEKEGGKKWVYGVEEGGGQESAAQDLGDFELCLVEGKSGLLSAGMTDAPVPVLLALEEIIGAKDPWARCLDPWCSAAPWAVQIEKDSVYHSRAVARTHSAPPHQAVPDISMFSALAEMQERFQRCT